MRVAWYGWSDPDDFTDGLPPLLFFIKPDYAFNLTEIVYSIKEIHEAV